MKKWIPNLRNALNCVVIYFYLTFNNAFKFQIKLEQQIYFIGNGEIWNHVKILFQNKFKIGKK